MTRSRQDMLKIAESIPPTTNFKFESLAKVKEKTVNGALNSYAKGCHYEDVIALMDTTLFHGGKEGFLLTKDKLYGDTFKRDPISLEGLTKVAPAKKNHLLLTYADGSSCDAFFTIFAPYIMNLLQALIEQDDIPQQAAAESDAPIPAGTSAEPADSCATNSPDESGNPDAASISNASNDSDAANGSNGPGNPDAPSTSNAPSDSSAANGSDTSHTSVPTDEWQIYEAEKLALEKERIAFKKEQQDFAQKQQELEAEKQTLAQELQELKAKKQTLTQERKDLRAEK